MVIVDQHEYLCEEEKRLKDDRERKRYWKKWGPYVAERQWATGGASLEKFEPLLTLRGFSERRLLVGQVVYARNQKLSATKVRTEMHGVVSWSVTPQTPKMY